MKHTFITIVLALIVYGCRETTTKASPPSDPKPGTPVSIDNFTFEPQVLTVHVGDKVTWTNHDDVPHNVKTTVKMFSSPALDTDQSFSYVFKSPGEYEYFCAIHPHMTAKVIVK